MTDKLLRDVSVNGRSEGFLPIPKVGRENPEGTWEASFHELSGATPPAGSSAKPIAAARQTGAKPGQQLRARIGDVERIPTRRRVRDKYELVAMPARRTVTMVAMPTGLTGTGDRYFQLPLSLMSREAQNPPIARCWWICTRSQANTEIFGCC